MEINEPWSRFCLELFELSAVGLSASGVFAKDAILTAGFFLQDEGFSPSRDCSDLTNCDFEEAESGGTFFLLWLVFTTETDTEGFGVLVLRNVLTGDGVLKVKGSTEIEGETRDAVLMTDTL